MVGTVYRHVRRPLAVGAGGLIALGLFSTAFAQDNGEATADLIGAIDTAWVLLCGFLVLFMQAGFAMLTGGFVRARATSNILMKNMIDACMGGLTFWAIGFAFAYGAGSGSNSFIGLGNFFLTDFDDYTTWFFQFAFAAAAATIVAGAMAERTKFSAYLLYTIVITGVIYPVVVHWGWDTNTWMGAFTDAADGPWLANGYVDFAGSGIVHTVGGVAGLMGAIAVGARAGKFGPKGEIRAIPGHNLGIATLGMFILWFGWYGFNAGSTLGLSDGWWVIAAHAAMTTTLSAAAGGVTAMGFSKLMTGRYDTGLTINGILAGLVGITAGTSVVDPWAAVVIGMVAAIIMFYGVRLLENLGIDDPVGAVPVHAMAGIWGVLAVGLFASERLLAQAEYANPSTYGLLLGGGIDQLAMQFIGITAIVAWVAVTAGILFFGIKYTIGLRISPEEEERGLDLVEHGIDTYPDFGSSAPQVFDPANGERR